jgi:hypothetical protein
MPRLMARPCSRCRRARQAIWCQRLVDTRLAARNANDEYASAIRRAARAHARRVAAGDVDALPPNGQACWPGH